MSRAYKPHHVHTPSYYYFLTRPFQALPLLQFFFVCVLVVGGDRSMAVVPVLVLLFVALWFIVRGDLFYVLPCVILFLCFFSPFSIAITSLGEERANT